MFVFDWRVEKEREREREREWRKREREGIELVTRILAIVRVHLSYFQ